MSVVFVASQINNDNYGRKRGRLRLAASAERLLFISKVPTADAELAHPRDDRESRCFQGNGLLLQLVLPVERLSSRWRACRRDWSTTARATPRHAAATAAAIKPLAAGATASTTAHCTCSLPLHPPIIYTTPPARLPACPSAPSSSHWPCLQLSSIPPSTVLLAVAFSGLLVALLAPASRVFPVQSPTLSTHPLSSRAQLPSLTIPGTVPSTRYGLYIRAEPSLA